MSRLRSTLNPFRHFRDPDEGEYSRLTRAANKTLEPAIYDLEATTENYAEVLHVYEPVVQSSEERHLSSEFVADGSHRYRIIARDIDRSTSIANSGVGTYSATKFMHSEYIAEYVHTTAPAIGSKVRVIYFKPGLGIEGVRGIFLGPRNEKDISVPDNTNQELSAKKAFKSEDSAAMASQPTGQGQTGVMLNGVESYKVNSKSPYGPGWRDLRPPGLPAYARRCSVNGAAKPEIHAIASTYNLDPSFARIMVDLATTESGARYGRPARRIKKKTTSLNAKTGWGAFQWDWRAWDYAQKRAKGWGLEWTSGEMWDTTPTQELSQPISYYAMLWRRVINAGGAPRDAVRYIRVYHRSPFGVAKVYLDKGKKYGGDFERAWQELVNHPKYGQYQGDSKSRNFNKKSIARTNHDMKRLGFA